MEKIVEFTLDAKEDLAYWKKINNQKILKRIRELLENILETPTLGIGKPEPLKHNFSGLWSRRINKETRIVYEVLHNKILVHSLKGHY
jgi:toxin YoeB